MDRDRDGNTDFSGIPPVGAVADRAIVGDAGPNKMAGILGATPLNANPAVVDRIPASPKLSADLRADLSKLTPSIARGVRAADAARRSK